MRMERTKVRASEVRKTCRSGRVDAQGAVVIARATRSEVRFGALAARGTRVAIQETVITFHAALRQPYANQTNIIAIRGRSRGDGEMTWRWENSRGGSAVDGESAQERFELFSER